MSYVKLNLICTSDNISDLIDFMESHDIDSLVPSKSFPTQFIRDYIDGKRSNIVTYDIDIGTSVIVLSLVACDDESKKGLVNFINDFDADEFPMRELPINFIKDYRDGKRDSLLLIELLGESEQSG